MEPVCSHNFSGIFQSFENRLNSLFQGNTKVLEGGDVTPGLRHKEQIKHDL